MRTIYSSAAMVRVWLGAGREGSDIAMLVLEKLCRGNPPQFANLEINGKPLLVDSWHASVLASLLDRPWWHRVWIQQEFVLATIPVLHC